MKIKISPVKVPVQKSRLYDHVEVLTNVQPARNHMNLDSLNFVSDYIINQFISSGFQTEIQDFTVNELEYRNIICRYGDPAMEKIVIGAHYDVCDDQPGADDNASAVAALLELSRVFNEMRPELKYCVEFVAYSLEEPPYFATSHMGSFVHAQSLHQKKERIKAMICMDMLGFYSEASNSQKFPVSFLKWFYPTEGNFITIVGRLKQLPFLRKFALYFREAVNIDVRIFPAPWFVKAIGLSDHRNYWPFGYKALMVSDTSFYRNPNYHQPTDTIDTLDFDKMTEVTKGIYWAAVNV